jgi:proteasome lid subunit RPN8/RPN11
MRSESSNPDSPSEEAVWKERAAAVPDRGQPAAVYPRELMGEVFAHARECYPEECCGLLIGESVREPRRVVRCTNVQNQRYAKGESHLDASHGFWIHEQELEAALRRADETGEALCVVYHSHVDTEAYLSRTDLLAATTPDGTPIWPGVAQLVVSVRSGAVLDAALFEWDAESGAYRGRLAREAR